MINDKDIEKLQEVFATKEDLKAFATKEDLKAFATKEDLKVFATKEDLKVFATKEDLKAFATKEDLKALRKEVLGGQDEILGKLDTLLQEKTIGDAQDKRRTKVLEIHHNALKRGKVLSEEEVSEVDRMQAF